MHCVPVVLPTAEALADEAARRFARAADAAVHAHGEFVVALAGGVTPRGLYSRLTMPPYRTTVPWLLMQVLWSDERCVPPDHAASNYRAARETLLDHVPIPEGNVHRIRGEDDPMAAARAYEQTLRAVLRTPQGSPRTAAGTRVDLVLLGLGADGHTASLFPGAQAVSDREQWAGARLDAARSQWRVTLMPAVINAAAAVLFLVSGEEKAAVVRRVFDAPMQPDELPAQLIEPTEGRLLWLLDAAAARDLEESR